MPSFIFNRKAGTVAGVRLSAVVETLIFLIGLCWLNFIFGDGSRFIDARFHPFWIIILLVTVQYGTAEGVIAAVLSTIFLYAGNWPGQLLDENYFEYQLRLGILPALWFMTAFILGELRMRIEEEKKQLRIDLVQAKSEVEKITAEYQTLKETNRNLEIHLAGQEDTVTSSFKAFKALESLEPAQVIFGLDALIATALHPKKFSVYANGQNGLEAVTSEGWSEKDVYCRRFFPTTPLFHAIVNDKKMIALVNKDDREILQHEGVVAAPLIDLKSGEVFGMLKIEEIDFPDLNLSRLQTFKIVCELVGSAYANAKKHRLAQQTAIYDVSQKLYSRSVFNIVADCLCKLEGKREFSLVVLKINFLNDKEMTENALKLLHTSLSDGVGCFEGEKKMKQVLLLCALSRREEVEGLKVSVERLLVESGFNREDFSIEQETMRQNSPSWRVR